MGSVYRVRDRSSGRPMALKRLEPGRASSRALRSSFEREYALLAQLAHPRIIEVYDYGVDERSAYYTMELLEGADMAELAPLPYTTVCHHLREVATSLALLHARRVVHRDVTPRNVRLTRDGHCKLLDFGALAAFGESSSLIGTPPSIPPEALEGEALDQRVDLYALGALSYFMLTGRHAYPASHTRQLPSYWARAPEPPSAVKPEVGRNGESLPPIPPELDQLVLWLLSLDRVARPASAGVVIDRIDVILGQRPGEERDLADSYLSSAPTVGREEELSVARRCLEQLARGRGSALLVQGPAGSGKTRLLSEVALEARLRGLIVVRADAEQHERPYAAAYALCREMLESGAQPALECAKPHAAVLAHVIPELATALGVEPAAPPPDPLLWRTRLQAALRGFVVGLSQRVPLLLIVDNVQRCDHASAVMLAAVAREAKHAPVMMIAAQRNESEVLAVAPCEALRQLSRAMPLPALSVAQTQAWFETLFGDAPNLTRLSRFLHDHTRGNPGGCMELLRFLVRAGELRYRDGAWVLPAEPAALELPSHVEDAVRRRVTALSPASRALAGALSMYRSAMTPELCRMLAGDIEDSALRSGLDELLARGVLALGRDGYAFSHESLREALQQEIGAQERARLHRRIAEAILARDSPHISERFEAALHLVEAGDERGMEMLCRGGVALTLRYDGLVLCVRALERAVELCKARGRSAYDLAPLLASLGVAAYVTDRRLDRYAPEIVACFEDVLGLSLARKLRPLLGRRLSVYAGLSVGALRHALQPARKRYATFVQLVQMCVTAITGLCGKAAICLDRPEVERLSATIEPLGALGADSAAQYAYDYCRGLAKVTGEDFARSYAYWLELDRRLHAPGGVTELPAEGRRLWEGGVHYVLGVYETLRGDEKVLERADTLEASEIDIHQLIAAQLRLQYHAFRGESEQMKAAFTQMEACAVQSGYTWQVQTWAAITVNLVGGLVNDLMMIKRALDETERMAVEVSSLERYAASSRALYLLQRGMPRECIEVYTEMFRHEAPGERAGWSASCGLLAEAHNQVGEHQRAKQLCEGVFRQNPDGAVYAGMRLPADLAYIAALTSLGDFAGAERHVEAMLALHADNGSPLVLGSLHEAAARTAILRKDKRAYSKHLKEVERAFCPLGNGPLIARFRRLTELGGEDGGVDAKIALMREVKAFETTLAHLNDRAAVARHVFTWLMQKCDGYAGYLLVRDRFGLVLLCSSHDDEPPLAALELVERSLQSLSGAADTTRINSEAGTQADNPDGGAMHVHLLSYVDGDQFFGEGALVLCGQAEQPPRIRYDLLQVAARQLHRLRAVTVSAKR
jgi:hypothetical protein